eukprot:3165227-Prorocentrum_lima.AAC.1
MTSSLVGSEMCIRDSFTSESHRTVHLQIAPSTYIAKSSRNEPPRNSIWPCLLYTSDAADDM